jgi:hypothetical protein
MRITFELERGWINLANFSGLVLTSCDISTLLSSCKSAQREQWRVGLSVCQRTDLPPDSGGFTISLKELTGGKQTPNYRQAQYLSRIFRFREMLMKRR